MRLTVIRVMHERRVISVVDADESVRQALEGLFRSARYLATASASAEEFLRCRDLGTTERLILDLRTPGMGSLAPQQQLAGSGQRSRPSSSPRTAAKRRAGAHRGRARSRSCRGRPMEKRCSARSRPR